MKESRPLKQLAAKRTKVRLEMQKAQMEAHQIDFQTQETGSINYNDPRRIKALKRVEHARAELAQINLKLIEAGHSKLLFLDW